MPRIPSDEIERLKAEVSLVRLVEMAGIRLERRGKDMVGKCPFHADDTPSLVVTPAKNLFHCFGCNAAGGVVDWVMRARGVSFRHAVELLKAETGLAGPVAAISKATVPVLPAPVAHDADDAAALAQVVDYYHATLKDSPEALAYLASRGLDHPDLIEQFRLGFANRTLGLRLPHKNRQAGAAIRGRLQALGVMRESGHEHFAGSLVVPIFDQHGAVAEMYGRKILDKLRPGTAYHLYLPGPHRGVWNAAALAASKEIIVCEALMDAMSFWCAGFRNVIAAFGVNGFTDEMRQALRDHHTQRVLIAYDRDAAGDAAAKALAASLRADGIEVFRVLFPHGMDANAYALNVKPAAQSLGLLLRQAEWWGSGSKPEPTEAAEPAAKEELGHEVNQCPPRRLAGLEVLPEPAESVLAPLPNATALLASQTFDPAHNPPEGPDVVEKHGNRDWRVKDWRRGIGPGVMRVTLRVASGDLWHMDTLDLYAAKARQVFINAAASELGAESETIKKDLGRILLRLETLADQTEPVVSSEATLSPEREKAAMGLLRDPGLIERIVSDLAASGVVGEAGNLLALYLAATSRKLERPLAVLVQSSSAAGKSTLVDAVFALMPSDEKIRYSAMTSQSLFYLGKKNIKHKILAIAEEEGVRQAAYALKLLQSDGELTIASTGKDDTTGNMVTREYRVEGPVMLMLTTTAIDIDEELLNRCLVLTIDESREQTRAILDRQRSLREVEGLRGRVGQDSRRQLHQDAQSLLRPIAVVNQFARKLTFTGEKLRVRRDHMKYLTLIEAIALLHQYQREVKHLTVGDKAIPYIEVADSDIALADRISREILGRALDDLPPQTRLLLSQVRQMAASMATDQGITLHDVRFTRRDIREKTGWSDNQLKVHCARLADMEFLTVHGGARGSTLRYGLSYDGQEVGGGEQKLGSSWPQVGGKLGRLNGAQTHAGQA